LSLWYIGNIREFIELEFGQEGLQGAHKPRGMPPELVAPSWLLWSSPKASWVSSGPEKINPKFFF
jgi:hypothetical protein